MSTNLLEEDYHGYTIRYKVVELTEGDFDKWVAEVLVNGTEFFCLRLIISRSNLSISRIEYHNEY